MIIVILKVVGRIIFYLGWPFLSVYLRLGKRTRIIICYEDRLLVVRGWIGNGRWSLPGGGIHWGENSLTGAVREIREETGIIIAESDLRLLGQASHNKNGLKFDYDRYYVNLLNKPKITRQKHEIADINWVTASELTLQNADQDVIDTLNAWKQGSPSVTI